MNSKLISGKLKLLTTCSAKCCGVNLIQLKETCIYSSLKTYYFLNGI